VLEKIKASGGHVYAGIDALGESSSFVGGKHEQRHGKFVRQLMGDEEPGSILLPANPTDAALTEARLAFPDTLILIARSDEA
jgi:hypothetical protein